MSFRTTTRLLLLPWAVSAGSVSLPADLAAQAESRQPPETVGAWIEEVRATPFHNLKAVGTPANPAEELAVDEGAEFQDMVRHPMTPSPGPHGSAASPGRVFAYASLAAFFPMVPAFISSFSTSIEGLMWIFLGSAATLASVPTAAMAAGATSLPRTMAGAATGLVAGAVFGMFVAGDWGDYWFAPVYSVTMGLVTAKIAVR
ncbi:MAG: hypothetical protein OXU69_11630 [Gemmatimonadota bacterium]|nr:hypothetical protein [Gemmatimonadota bacterium]